MNKIDLVRKLDPVLHNCLLLIFRSMHTSKAKSDYNHLKAQREEKCRKEELLLEMKLDKASEKFVDAIFYYDNHARRDC